MAEKYFAPLTSEVLYEFDQAMTYDREGNGVLADFYASGNGGETRHLADEYWKGAQTITRQEAIPPHINDLLTRSRGEE